MPRRSRLPLFLGTALGALILLIGEVVVSASTTPQDRNVPGTDLPLEVTASATCPVPSLPARTARACAEVAARLKALDQVLTALPHQRDWRLGLPDSADPRACVALLYSGGPRHRTESGGDGAVTVTLRARADAAEIWTRLRRNAELPFLQQNLLQELETVWGKFVEASRREATADVTAGKGGIWYRAAATPDVMLAQDWSPNGSSGDPQATAELEADKLEAALDVQEVLQAATEDWVVRAEALPTLERAAPHLPQNAVVWAMLAEAQLRSSLPQRCVDSSSRALRLSPSLSRARYIRALAHWRLQQLALAESDLTASLDGRHGDRPEGEALAARLRARGAVRLLRRNETGMCEDFFAACALGDCEGLTLARRRQQCLDHDQTQNGLKGKTR